MKQALSVQSANHRRQSTALSVGSSFRKPSQYSQYSNNNRDDDSLDSEGESNPLREAAGERRRQLMATYPLCAAGGQCARQGGACGWDWLKRPAAVIDPPMGANWDPRRQPR